MPSSWRSERWRSRCRSEIAGRAPCAMETGGVWVKRSPAVLETPGAVVRNLLWKGPNMQDVARGIGLVVALAIGVGCSSTSTNEGAAASGGASSGGAASGGAAGSAGAGSGGAASGGAGQDASSGGASALIWCSAVKDCIALCGALQPVCTKAGDVCRCNTADCLPGKTDVCPAGMTCSGSSSCYPDGEITLGEPCSWPTKRCVSGLICGAPNEVWDAGFDFRCRKPCDPAKPPAGCNCSSKYEWCD